MCLFILKSRVRENTRKYNDFIFRSDLAQNRVPTRFDVIHAFWPCARNEFYIFILFLYFVPLFVSL